MRRSVTAHRPCALFRLAALGWRGVLFEVIRGEGVRVRDRMEVEPG